MNLFTEKVIEIIRAIPEGRVMTYGQIAKEAGKQRVLDKYHGFYMR